MAVTAADVQRAFQNSLGRAPSQADVDAYVAASNSGALTDTQIYTTISNSREADLISDPVVRFYQSAFGRVPDQDGLDNAQDFVRANGASAATYQALAQGFVDSQEFINRFGSGTTVTAAYVQALYTTILGRTATSAEIDGYTSGSNGYTTRAGVLYAISQSQEAIGISDNAVNGFLLNAAEGDAVYTGTLYTPENGAPDLPSQGQTIPLRVGVETATGTQFDDVFLGTTETGQNGTNVGTFNSGDNISGGGGNDTLKLTLTSAGFGNQIITPTLTSVENIEAQALGGDVINLANATGLQKISSAGGFGNVSFFNINNNVDLDVSGTQGGEVELVYGGTVASATTDTQKITINNASTDLAFNGTTTIDVSDVETFAITATGTNNVSLNANNGFIGINDTLSTVTVAGAGSLTINNNLSTKVTSFDASAASGSIDVGFIDGADVNVKGGSAADIFRFGVLTTGDVVNGGDGVDTVRVTNTGLLDTADGAAPFNNLVSVEKVAFDGGGVTLNGSTFTNSGITNIEFNTVGDDTINNAGSARTYEFGVDNTGAATFALSANATNLKLALLGGVGLPAANDGDDADVAGITITTSGANSTTTPVNITLDSQGDLADTFFSSSSTNQVGLVNGEVNQTGLVTVASGSTVTVTGAGNLAVFGGPVDGSAVAAGFANNVTLDASAATGNSVLAGSSFANVGVPAPAGTNTSTTQGVDTFNLGSGKNVIVFADGLASGVVELATVNNVDGTATGNILVDTITGFTAGAGGDVLSRDADLSNGINTGAATNYTSITADTQAAIAALSGANATLQAAANLAAGDAAANWTAFSFQNVTYALFDANNGGATYENGVDNLVKLTGVTVANLTDANFAV